MNKKIIILLKASLVLCEYVVVWNVRVRLSHQAFDFLCMRNRESKPPAYCMRFLRIYQLCVN